MRTISTIALAGLLIVSAAAAASAQVNQRGNAAARAQTAPNVVSDPYGERPTDPNSTIPCSQRPFAQGCDKRGFW